MARHGNDVLWIDIETKSRADLRKVGVYRYVEDPDWAILMAAWAMNDDPVRVAFTLEDILAIPGLLDSAVVKVAHNATFERVNFSRAAGLPTGEYLPARDWRDTMIAAAEHGYPQSLDMLARSLHCAPKDSAGTSLIRLFSVPRSTGKLKGTFVQPEERPAEWADFAAYCVQDVETLREVGEKLPDIPTAAERRVWLANEAINDRGIQVDLRLAKRAMRAGKLNADEQVARIRELTGVDNPGSVQQMMAWARREGLNLPNMQKGTLEAALSGPLTPEQREVLELRQELALVAAKKYSAALASACEDGRLRGTLRFFGAHTGRWSGQGVQLQNLPRESLEDDDAVQAAVLDLAMGARVEPVTLKALVRPMFLGPLTVVDYSAIEARVIAWLAGEQWALDAFAAGRDIYVEVANRMGGLTRSQGKVATLALGYQGSIGSLRAMGAEGEDDELLALVRQWRSANTNIVRLWGRLDNALGSGGRIGDHLYVEREKGTMRIHLPSGRAITYHGVRWSERLVTLDDGRQLLKRGWSYRDPRTGKMIDTYGGRLSENATQAVARDLLAAALVRFEKRGYRVVGHVHDEVLVEGHHPVDEIASVMTELPPWAEGLPVDAAGFTCDRYKKG